MDVPKEKIQSGHLGVTDLALNEMSRSPSTEETDPSTLSKHVQTPESSQEPIFASAWPPCHVCPNPLLLSAILDDRRRYSFPSFESWLPYFKDSWVDKELLASRPSLFRERAEDEPARKEEHNKYMKILLGDEEELSPAIPGTDCFNPVLERFWLSWARAVHFSHEFIAFDHPIRNAANHLASDAIRQQIAWSVPTLPVLRYMVQTAPGGRILDVGAGTGYWSALLAGLGADVIAVDNFSWWPKPSKTTEEDSPGVQLAAQRPLYFDVQDGAAADYVSVANDENRALFFSWPKGVMWPYLKGYTGDVIFWVGEDEGTTDGIWTEHRTGWLMERRMEIPQWPGFNDYFAAYRRMR